MGPNLRDIIVKWGNYWGYIEIMEKKMETILNWGKYWGYIGVMEKKMETVGIMGLKYVGSAKRFTVYVLRFREFRSFWGIRIAIFRDLGKCHGADAKKTF